MSAVVEREKWESVIIIMSKFCFGFVVVMGDMELSVISRSPGVAVSAVADRQDITLARVGGGWRGENVCSPSDLEL